MFDLDEAFRILEEPCEGLSRSELEERLALNRDLATWTDDRTAAFRSEIARREAER